MKQLLCLFAVSLACSSTLSPKDETTTTQLTFTLPNDVEISFIQIPAGTFMMGSPETQRGRHDDEIEHAVTISSPFSIGTYEVTQAQWLAVMKTMPSEKCTPCEIAPDQPMTCISWNHIAGPGGFLETINNHKKEWGLPSNGIFRLPTEAEWEYAARAGTETRFSFGDAAECSDECEFCETMNDSMVWCGNSTGCTVPVGTKKPNPFGLYDMHGNAWEWVNDHFGRYTAEAQIDPQGPTKGAYHQIRGCSWTNHAAAGRSAARNGDDINHVGDILGFRLVWSKE